LFKGKRKNQKNSQAVSPLNLLARGRRNEEITYFCFLQNFHLQKNKVLKQSLENFLARKSNGQWLEKDCEKGLFGRIYYFF